jgi:hypothetical protein
MSKGERRFEYLDFVPLLCMMLPGRPSRKVRRWSYYGSSQLVTAFESFWAGAAALAPNRSTRGSPSGPALEACLSLPRRGDERLS